VALQPRPGLGLPYGFHDSFYSTMWGYQLHDLPVLDTLIQPSKTSSSHYQRLSQLIFTWQSVSRILHCHMEVLLFLSHGTKSVILRFCSCRWWRYWRVVNCTQGGSAELAQLLNVRLDRRKTSVMRWRYSCIVSRQKCEWDCKVVSIMSPAGDTYFTLQSV
jgi:hypothetical protein